MGLASAKTTGLSAMLFTIAGLTRLAPDTPTNTSAPSIASASVRSLVLRAKALLEAVEVGAALVHHALGIDQHDVGLFRPHRHQQFHRRDAGRTCAKTDDLRAIQRLALHLQRIDEAGADDDGGAVLVVVEHRDIELFLQRGFDFEAMRRGDVFEVDATEGRGDGFHHLDEVLRRLGVDFDVEDVDAGELLEQHGLAFHHRLGGERAEIAQPEDGGAIGDHRNQVALVGVVVGVLPGSWRFPARAALRPGCRRATNQPGWNRVWMIRPKACRAWAGDGNRGLFS